MKPTFQLLLLTICLAGFTSATFAQTWNTTGNAAISSDFIGTTNKINLKFKTRNIARMTIDTTGKVGIGTTTPLSGLHIVSVDSVSATKNGKLMLGNSTDFNLIADQNDIQAKNNGSASVLNINPLGGDLRFGLLSKNHILTSAGFLGLGITNPSTTLHIGSGSQISLTSGGYQINGIMTGQNIAIDPDDIQARNNNNYSTLFLNYYGGDIWMNGAATPLVFKNGSGYLGIGKSSPAARVDVYRGRMRFSGQVSAGTASGIEFTDTTGISLKAFVGMTDNNTLGMWGFGGAGWNFKMNVNDGRISIGKNINPATGYMLAVDGGIICEEVKVQMTPFPDYVFGENYRLRSLEEVEQHILEHKRLPGMPSAEVVDCEGMNVGELSTLLVEKVEELTLYILRLQKEIDELKSCQSK
jgi:hypothetical protein